MADTVVVVNEKKDGCVGCLAKGIGAVVILAVGIWAFVSFVVDHPYQPMEEREGSDETTDRPLAARGEEWRIEKNVDSVTDKQTCSVWKRGDLVVMDEILHYYPEIVVRLSPTDDLHGKGFEVEVMFVIEHDGMRRNGVVVTSRFDNEQATKAEWSTSTDRRGAFAPNPEKFVEKMMEARQLQIRFETTLGNIRTLRFDLDGLKPKLIEAQGIYLRKQQSNDNKPDRPEATEEQGEEAEWRIEEKADETKDAVSILLSKEGDKVDGAGGHRPSLVVRVYSDGVAKDGKPRFRAQPYFAVQTDGLQRGGCKVASRFDEAKAEQSTWKVSTDGHAAFAPDPGNFTRQICAATNLTLRFKTTHGDARTLRFDCSGLRPKLKEARDMYLQKEKSRKGRK